MPLFLVYIPLIALGLKSAGFWFHGTAVVMLAVLGRSAGFGSLEFLSYALNGVAFAYAFAYGLRKGYSLFHIVLLCTMTELIFMGVCEVVPVYRTEYVSLIKTTSDMAMKALKLPATDSALTAFQWKYILPMSELFKAMLTSFLLSVLFSKLAGREKFRIADFEVPNWFSWVFALGLFLSIYRVAGQTGFFLLAGSALFYLFNGVSIVRKFCTKTVQSKLTEGLFYVVQPGLLFIPVFAIGLLETWWDFRLRIESIGQEENKEN